MDGKDYIAYFTMEIGLDESMPTYAGGLGILAGNTVRSAADLGIPMVVVTLLHRKGYFRQRIDASGWQSEEDVAWPVAELLQEMQPRYSIEIEGRQVLVRAWKYEVKGVSGYSVQVYFLDTDLEQNAAPDRTITDHHYRPTRNGRNPKTVAPVKVPARHVPHFKAGLELRKRIDYKH